MGSALGALRLSGAKTADVLYDRRATPYSQLLDLAQKRHDNFRTNDLTKLVHSKVWVPRAQRPPKYQTVVIFDWDDTLLCTSHLNRLSNDWYLPMSVDDDLYGIEHVVTDLLEIATRVGPTFIITNAEAGWVQSSAAKWLPKVFDMLKSQQVRVISARTNHEGQHPDEPGQWKLQAFLEVQRKLNFEIITNLLSFGDSHWEIDAARAMGKEFHLGVVKTIKFRENPSSELLLRQLRFVAQKFEAIMEIGDDATLTL